VAVLADNLCWGEGDACLQVIQPVGNERDRVKELIPLFNFGTICKDGRAAQFGY